MGFEILGLNLVTTVGILGAVLLVLGFMKMYKSKNTKKMANVLGIAFVGLFFATAFVSQLSSVTWLTSDWNTKPASVGTGTVGGDLPNTGSCLGIEDTTVTLSAVDKYTGSATGGTHRYKVNNGVALTVSDAGTITASPGDVIDLLWGNASTDDKFFGEVSRVIVPCSGTFRIAEKLVQNETGALDVDFYNRDLIKMDEGATANGNQTLGDSDEKTIKMRWSTSSQKGYAHGVLAIFEYNKTAFDSVNVLGAQSSATPSFYTVGNSFRTTSAYIIPGQEDVKETEYLVNVKSSSNGPIVSDATSNGMNVTFVPLDYYIDEDNGGAFAGPAVEDEDNVKTFPHTGTVVNIYFA